jgi:5-methylcytosine-specific restriction enzyme subunit McrC
MVAAGQFDFLAGLRQNICRRDRFFAEFDEFSTDRPENRLLHSASRRTLLWTTSQANEQLSRELGFVFVDVPPSDQPSQDFERVRLDRGMAHYDYALAWARLILNDESPLTGSGQHFAPSLLFPMEAVFEALVAKHLARQLVPAWRLRTQARSLSLVRHRGQDWFRLKPDLLIHQGTKNRGVLDTKWKLIDNGAASGTDKYGLDQGDFYQLHAYGQSYLDGQGDVVLIYPRTEVFDQALPVFEFPKTDGVRLWVLPFCLRERELVLPPCGGLDGFFKPNGASCGGLFPPEQFQVDGAEGLHPASVF